MLEQILAYPLRVIANFFAEVIGWLGGKSLTELLGNNTFPFSEAEWSQLLNWYNAIGLIGQGLLFVAVIATGLKFTAASMNARLRVEASEAFVRLFGAVFLILTAPFFAQTLFHFNATISSGLMDLASIALSGASMPDLSFFSQIQTTSNLVDAVVILVFSGLMLYLNIIFLIRKFVLAALLLFTPFVAFMWVLNKNVNAAGIYLGEILSNAFMPTAYAFTILVFSIFAPSQHWIHTLVWTISLVVVAEMIRNSIQGLWTRLSGIDEVGAATRVMGALGFGGLASVSRVASVSLSSAPYAFSDRIDPSFFGNTGIVGNSTGTVSIEGQKIKEPDEVVPKPATATATPTPTPYPALRAAEQPALAKALNASQGWGAIAATTVGRAASIALSAMPGGGKAVEGITKIAGGLGRAAAFGVSAINYYRKEYEPGKRWEGFKREMGIGVFDNSPIKTDTAQNKANIEIGLQQEEKEKDAQNKNSKWQDLKAIYRGVQLGYINMGAPSTTMRVSRTYVTNIDGFRWR